MKDLNLNLLEPNRTNTDIIRLAINRNETDITNKIDKVTPVTTGNLVKLKSDGSLEMIIPDTWHYVGAVGEPSFQNSWVNVGSPFESARFRYIEISSVIELQGVIRNGTSGNICFTLPLGYRPTKRIILPAIDSSSTFTTNIYRLDIFPTGDILVYGGTSYKSLYVKFPIEV